MSVSHDRGDARCPLWAYPVAFVLAAMASALAMMAFVPWIILLVVVFFCYALVYGVVLGLPLFLIVRAAGGVNAITSTIGGMVVGALAIVLVSWPSYKSGYSYNGIDLIINGRFTRAGWIDLAGTTLWMAAAGALGGFVFWLTLRYFGSPKDEGDRQNGSSNDIRGDCSN